MRVVLIMLDGLRPDALLQVAPPNLTQFLKRSAYTLQGRSVMPSITLPCHTSIFHSVPPQRHGIMENVWHPMARPVPGLVERLNAAGKQCAFFHNWEPLRDMNRPENLYFSYYIGTGYQLDGDAIIASTASQMIAPHGFDFSFVYLGTIDVAGHAFGWMSDGYLQQIQTVDALVGQVIASLPADTTVIIHSDHGGHERDHGTEMPEDMTIPWMIAGPNIREDYAIQRPVSLLDTAPTITHILQAAPAKEWEGTAVTEAFLSESLPGA